MDDANIVRDIAKARDQQWLQSMQRNWVVGRLGIKQGGGYLIDVPGRPGWVYVSLGVNGERGQAEALDKIGLAPVGFTQIRMRRENGILVVREAGNQSEPGGGGATPTTHDLDSIYHSGTLASSQGPQFLLTSGIRNLTGNLGVDSGITIDGVDISVHAADPAAHHDPVTVGNGLDLTGQLVSLGLAADPGLEFTGGDVRVKAYHGINRDSNGIGIDLKTLSGMEVDSSGLAMGDPTTLTFATTNAVAASSHGHAITASADVGTTPAESLLKSTSGGGLTLAGLTMRGNIAFAGGDRSITASNKLTLAPTGDLLLDPTGLILLPTPQELRTETYNDFVAGIAGLRHWDTGGNVRQLTIGKIKADELHVRVFSADEQRVSRAAEFWSYGFGIVETEFIVPADEVTVDVWFEEAPDLGDFKLFLPEHWILIREIEVTTGLLTQAVWFQVVDGDGAGLNDYLEREDADDAAGKLSRQQWRLRRKSGGTTGTTIHKGKVAVDFGLPFSVTTPAPGQGVVHLSALAEDGGPFVQIQTFESVVADVPQFKNRVRMGNLSGTVDYASDIFGFATGNDLSLTPSAGFSGMAADAEGGLRLFNTDIELWESGDLVITIEENNGVSFLQDSVEYGNFNRYLTWRDDLPSGVLRGTIGSHTSTTGSILKIQENAYGAGQYAHVQILGIQNTPVQQASLTIASSTGAGFPESFVGILASRASIGAERTVVGNQVDYTAADSTFHVRENTAEVGTAAGVTIEQDGVGDAILQFWLTDGQRFVTGIDNSDGDKWKLAVGGALDTDTIFTVDPATNDLIFTDQMILTGQRWGLGTLTPGDGLADGAFDYPVANYGILHINTDPGNTRLIAQANNTVAIDLIDDNSSPDAKWFQIYKYSSGTLLMAMNDLGSMGHQFMKFDHQWGFVGIGDLPSDLLGATLDIAAAAGSGGLSSLIRTTNFGATPSFNHAGRRALGTKNAPTSIADGSVIFSIAGLGYTSGGWATDTSGEIALRATEAFNTGVLGKGGAEWLFYVRANGETAVAEMVSINQDGLDIRDNTIGDSQLRFTIGGQQWVAGVDVSDGGNFKISVGNVLGFSDFFMIEAATGVIYGNFDGAVGAAGTESMHNAAVGGDGIDVSLAQSVSVDATVARIVDMIAGGGLTGGGTLAANRTFAVGAGAGITVNADDVALASSAAGAGMTFATGVLNVIALSTGGLQVNADSLQILMPFPSGLTTDATGLYVADAIAGAGLVIASKVLAVGAGTGIAVNANDVALAATVAGAGLTHTTGVLAVGAGAAISVSADAVAVNLGSNSGLNVASGLVVDSSLAGAGMSLTAGVMNVVAANASLTVGANDLNVNLAHAFVWSANHTWNTGVFTFNTAPQVGANLNFIGSARSLTSAASFSITPTGDLTLDPSGNIYLPDAQEMRAVTFSDLVTGIAGFRLWDRGSNYHQLTTGAMKVDELYARVFVADETRIDRGEEYWSKSYGVVETDFTLPADEASVSVWFENATGIGTGNIFAVGDYLLLRAIDWLTGIAIVKVWFTVVSLVTAGSVDGYRQQWSIKRETGGTTGLIVKKGNTILDAGQIGQGWIHLSALSQDGGPFIQVGDFTSVVSSDTPVFTNRVRMGNLNTVAGLSGTYWGVAAGNNLALTPATGFSGFTAEATNGMRLYNTEIDLYNGATKNIKIDQVDGITILLDDTGGTLDRLAIRWEEDVDNPGGTDNRVKIIGQTVGTATSLDMKAYSAAGLTSVSLYARRLDINRGSTLQLTDYTMSLEVGDVDVITVDDGIVTVPVGLSVPAALKSGTATISDDAVHSFAPPQNNGIMTIWTTQFVANTAMMHYRVSSPALMGALVVGANVNVTSGVLTGTTGTDGKLTFSCHTDGLIYINNRLGGAVTVEWLLFG